MAVCGCMGVLEWLTICGSIYGALGLGFILGNNWKNDHKSHNIKEGKNDKI
jgi:hypothetical protein